MLMSNSSAIKAVYDPKLTPATLTAYLDDNWIPSKHLMFISAKVATALQKGAARLIISVPPRHGKSRMLSIGTTIWALEKYLKHYIGLCTYGADLSKDFSGAVRDQIEANPNKLETRIRAGNNRIDRFLTEKGGGVFSFGLNGVLTGRGFNLFFLDDFIKHVKEALSETYRQAMWDWFTTTAYTRLEPGASVIIIATRWHKDDLIGKILKEFGPEWEYIQLPAIAKHGDILGRQPGEALFPERYGIEELLKTKRLLGTYWFSALYQQDPSDDSAKMADKAWLRYCYETPNPALLKWARIWDFGGLKQAGDYSVGSLMGADKRSDTAYITDVQRGQWSPNDLDTKVKETAEADGKGVTVYICQEPGSSGMITTNHFRKLLGPGYTVEGVPELENKAAKAHGVLAGAEDGRLFLKHGEWNHVFEEEWDAFPNGDWDDQVDTVAIGWNKLIGVLKLGATWGRNNMNKGGSSPTTPGAIYGSGTANISGCTWGRRKSGLLVPQ